MPGMWTMADMRCDKCTQSFWGDLPVGHALYAPLILEQTSGDVFSRTVGLDIPLRDSYANPSSEKVAFTVEEFRLAKKPVLLNCLDFLYGHSLLKLLNAQGVMDAHPYLDLIVLVPPMLRWMVPDGVAAIWTIALPLRRGTEWNTWIGAEISRRITPYQEAWISVAYPHHPCCDISRFTKQRPFPRNEWPLRLNSPRITFVWREESSRMWVRSNRFSWHWNVLKEQLHRCIRNTETSTKEDGVAKLSANHEVHYLQRLMRIYFKLRRITLTRWEIWRQRQQMIRTFRLIRQKFPAARFSVVGFAKPESLPHWIEDLRVSRMDNATERIWCLAYADSHVVIGTHGSNMILPTAHAGSAIILMPADRWGVFLQDTLVDAMDPRDALFHYRSLPCSVAPEDVANNVVFLLNHQPYFWATNHARRLNR